MKTITRSNIYLPMAAMILAAALAVPAAAQKPVPFEGALQWQDADKGGPDTAFVVDTSGTGIGTPVGQFSFTQEATVNLVTGAETGSAHWIAANGDSIYTTIAGSVPSSPRSAHSLVLASGLIRITEIHTITGGTGRFAGAQGSFAVDRLASPTAFITFGSFHGSITSPGAAQ
jgi:hypothetical protein